MKDLMSEYSAFTPKVIEKEKWKKRQKEGIEAAKKRGVHTGRRPIVKPDNFNETYMKWKAGLITAREAMRITGLAPSTFYRLASKIKAENEKSAN
jgi:DNA invertase Pin-like site-specific DNA recombinase